MSERGVAEACVSSWFILYYIRHSYCNSALRRRHYASYYYDDVKEEEEEEEPGCMHEGEYLHLKFTVLHLLWSMSLHFPC